MANYRVCRGKEVTPVKKRLLCVLLCLCLCLCCIPAGVWAADKPLTGTVDITSGYLKMRQEAPDGKEVGQLYDGDTVTILDSIVVNNQTWYKVTNGKATGWSSASYIVVNYSYENDEDFEAYLTAQKFPESYKVKLRQIHAQYPKWVFNAQHLSMTWATALAEETKTGKNAVQQYEAWMSMEKGAYNWTTGKYVSVDSGGWVNAAPAVVAYHMDPRNFLEPTYVFQFEDLKYAPTHTVEGIQAIFSSRYDGYAADLLKAAKEAQVSAYHLATRMEQEGSKVDGTYPGYEGYYNFFNIGAYSHSGNSALLNGAIYAKNKGWTSPYLCFLGSAQELARGYISKGQNTLYYQKFNVAGENLYNHQYMSNVQAPWAESAKRYKSATAAEKDNALTFVIPVYKEMPETAAPLPGTTGNNNNFLDSLTVTGCTIGPSFDRYTLEYTGAVGEGVTSVTVAATKNYANAKMTGTGTITLKPGENVIPITVTATSGQVRVYNVIITAPGDTPPDDGGGTVEPEKLPTVTGTAYTLTETINGVKPNTTVADLIKNLGIKDGSAVLCDSSGKQKADGIAATGDILEIRTAKGALHKQYPVVIRGDVNGDGKVTSQDLRRTQRHILGVAKVEGYFLTAADANGDGNVTSQDLRRTQRFILGILTSL